MPVPDKNQMRARQTVQEYVSSRGIKSPAFVLGSSGQFEPSEDSRRVLLEMKRLTGRTADIRPANSVQVDPNSGTPLWGSGGGVAATGTGLGYVDPLEGTSHVLAHEAAHAIMPHRSTMKRIGASPFSQGDPLNVPRDSGQRVRYVHEELSKPAIVEESHAQGVADGVLERLGLPTFSDPSWGGDALAYPRSYMTRTFGTYGRSEVGPPSHREAGEFGRIEKGTDALSERIYREGRRAAAR